MTKKQIAEKVEEIIKDLETRKQIIHDNMGINMTQREESYFKGKKRMLEEVLFQLYELEANI